MHSELQPDEFRLLADNVPAMLWRTTDALVCDWFNSSWLEFAGLTLVEAIEAGGWLCRVHPDDADAYVVLARRALEAREPFRLEYRLRRSDGTYRWILDSGRPYYRDSRFAGFLGSCVDISDHRAAEDSLRLAMEERDVLVREVHHRVKNNMQTLMALVRFMRRSADAAGRSLLDVLNARLISMAIVQRYLHGADNMTEVSLKTLLGSMAPQLAEAECGVSIGLADEPIDLVLPAQTAAYTGLAVAEAAVLMSQCGATRVAIRLRRDPEPAVEVIGAASGQAIAASQLGIRLVRQYARGAGAVTMIGEKDEAAVLVFRFSAESICAIGPDLQRGGASRSASSPEA